MKIRNFLTLLLLVAAAPNFVAADTTISSGLTVVIPDQGSRNWFTLFKNSFATPISAHDHTGSGKGLNISTNAIAANAVTNTKTRLANDGYLRARNAANSADINICKVDSSDKIRFDTSAVSNDTKTDLGIGTGSSPTFTGATFSGLTASSLVATNGSKALTSTTSGITPSFASATLAATSSTILGTTSDGSDNQSFAIAPATAVNGNRSARLALYGNEHAQAGQAALFAGDNGLLSIGTSGTGAIQFFGGGSAVATMNSTGVFNLSSLDASEFVKTDGSKNLVSVSTAELLGSIVRATWVPTLSVNTGAIVGTTVRLARWYEMGPDIFFDIVIDGVTSSGSPTQLIISAPAEGPIQLYEHPCTIIDTGADQGKWSIGDDGGSTIIVAQNADGAAFASSWTLSIQGRYEAD